MNLMSLQAETRYDLKFRIAGIPVRVHPLFWLIALLFGYGLSNNILIGVFAVFVALLVHELGHAFIMERYGKSSSILLYAGGGLTIPEQVRWGNTWMSVSLTYLQEIMISLSGALAGFFLAGLLILVTKIVGGEVVIRSILLVIPYPVVVIPINVGFLYTFINSLLNSLILINIFWGVINLMPVYPLDGGNIARQIWLKVDPIEGVNKSLWLSVIAGGLIALIGLFGRQIFLTLIFGLMAFQSYRLLHGQAGGFY